MLFRLEPQILVMLIPALMFALSFHEFAHAWMAYRLGDPTAAMMGRKTLNPLAHLDIMGSIMILFVGFGWAKPVPVNYYNLQNPSKDIMKVSLAGPLSNLLLALIGGILLRVLNLVPFEFSLFINTMLWFFVYINIALAVFNLIPLAPLDGSKIFGGFIAKKSPNLAHRLETQGPMILFSIILIDYFTNLNILSTIMSPFIRLFMALFLP